VEEHLRILELDLLDYRSVERALSQVVEAEGGVDTLINNAGYGLISGVEQATLEQMRAVMETDFVATMGLIQQVIPVMRRQHAGHIINVSTIFAAGPCPPAIGFYVAAKAALDLACQALACEVAPWNIALTSFQPGPVDTQLERQYGARFDGQDDPRPTIVDDLYSWIGQGSCPPLQPPAEVAQALAEVVEDPSPPMAAQTSAATTSYVARVLRDPSREAESRPLLEHFTAP
jgi:NAD(P)-dependent dehydrogenase (short-subunit alcohol dehydrogenase family)